MTVLQQLQNVPCSEQHGCEHDRTRARAQRAFRFDSKLNYAWFLTDQQAVAIHCRCSSAGSPLAGLRTWCDYYKERLLDRGTQSGELADV